MVTVPKAHPHWKRMRFKNNKVWVAVDRSNQAILKGGKALIKYQLNQDHEYWVFAKNLAEIDDAIVKASPRTQKAKAANSVTPVQADPDSETAIQVFTDGACSGNPGPAGIGIVMRYKGKRKEISKYIGSATNNIAELEAIRTALLSIKNRELPVVLHTDSQYALGLLSQGWKARQNLALVDEIRDLVDRFPRLQFVKVKGHAGHADNERADQLAVQAIENAG